MTIKVNAKLDYDGFYEYKFAVTSPQASNLDCLEVRLPLTKETTKYLLHNPLVQNAGALTGCGWRGQAGTLWIGNEQEGLFFSFDTTPFRSRDRRRQLEVEQGNDGRAALVIRLADSAGQLQDGENVFRFFLLPTPSKPYPQKPIQSWMTWIWEGWSSHHGYPALEKIPELKAAVAENARQGLYLSTYCCQGLQEDAPEMTAYRSDFEMLPSWLYYKWQGHDCYATCKRGPEGELQLYNYARIIRETGIRGLMSDGLSCDWGDANVLHPHGCGRPVKVSLEEDTESRTVATRNFLKRCRGLFHREYGDEFALVAHTGGGMDPNTLSFFDAYFEGEQLMRFRRGFYPSQALFCVGYTGQPWGWRTIFWAKQLRNFNGMETALGYSLLFNSESSLNPWIDGTSLDVQLLLPFATADSEFHPFWKPQDLADFDGENCLMSLYANPREAMAVVSNLNYLDGSFRLDLSRIFPGRDIEIRDLLADNPLPSPIIEAPLPPHGCRIIRVRPHDTRPPKEYNGFADCRFTGQHDLADDGTLVLHGVPGGERAAVFLPELPAGRDFTLTAEIRFDGRLAVDLKEGVTLLRENSFWQLRQGFDDYWGVVDGGMLTPPDRFQTLHVVCEDGCLTVTLGGRKLVQRKPILAAGPWRPALATWHDNTLEIRRLRLIDRREEILAEEGREPQVSRTSFLPEDWTFVNADQGAISPDGEFLLKADPSRGQARAEFRPLVGRDFTLEMDIALAENCCVSFELGNVVLGYGSCAPGWGWNVSGEAKPDGRGWVFLNAAYHRGETKRLKYVMRDGVLDVWYDGQRIVRQVAFTLPAHGNQFAIRVWYSDTVKARMIRLDTAPSAETEPAPVHPILEYAKEQR